MKFRNLILFILAAFVFSTIQANQKPPLVNLSSTQSKVEGKPNIIVVLADDLGVGDVSKYRRLHTTNIKI